MNKNATQLIDDSGRIVLPREVWQAMNWAERTPVEIWLNGAEDEVVIKRHISTCLFCGTTEQLKAYRKGYICATCKKEITAL